MDGLDPLDVESSDTVFRDVIMLALAGFVAIVIILLPHLNPPGKAVKTATPPGNVIVELRWPDSLNTDVDLWVKGPRDVPVGYSNQGGLIFNLLRDDRGREGDATKDNYEITYSRGILKGEYIVNVHMYGPLPPNTTVPVTIVVSVRQKFDNTRQILQTMVNLNHHHQEETAFRFRLTRDGDLVDGSVSTLRRPLITGLK